MSMWILMSPAPSGNTEWMSQRVLVTGDADFLRFAARERDHPGIVFCTKIGMAVGEIVHHLVLVYEVLSVEEMSGRVEHI